MNTKPMRILVIDESVKEMQTTKDLLDAREYEYEVDYATDYKAALELLQKYHYDVALVEYYRSGGPNGLEIIEMLVEMDCGFPAVLTAPQTDVILDREAIMRGAYYFIAKNQFGERAEILERILRYALASYEKNTLFKFKLEKDPATGVLNRTHFTNRLIREVSLVSRHGYPCAMALGDIDVFKQVNDSYGHPIGDEIIMSFVKAMYEQLRQEDVIGRFGGDEFAVLFPHTDVKKAADALNRVREQFNSVEFKADNLRTGQEEWFSVTVSFGVTGINKNISAPLVIRRADMALYQSKHDGRNRVTIDDGPKPH